MCMNTKYLPYYFVESQDDIELTIFIIWMSGTYAHCHCLSRLAAVCTYPTYIVVP